MNQKRPVLMKSGRWIIGRWSSFITNNIAQNRPSNPEQSPNVICYYKHQACSPTLIKSREVYVCAVGDSIQDRSSLQSEEAPILSPNSDTLHRKWAFSNTCTHTHTNKTDCPLILRCWHLKPSKCKDMLLNTLALKNTPAQWEEIL